MKIRGLNAEQVNEQIDTFHALMMKGMRAACTSAASYAFSGHLVAAGEEVTPATSGDLSTAVDALSVITTQWGEYVTGSLMPELNTIATKSANAIVSPLGGMPTVKTESFISEMTNKITVFGDDVWQAAKASLITGAQDGESIAELSARVEQVAQVKTKKAHVIAQTTVIAAINGGEWHQMMEAAAAFDVQGMKEWEATEDSHTRPTHHEADGQRVPIDAHFVVGGSFLMFPGDPEGAPEEIISCRCTTLYDLDMEDQTTASQTSPVALSADSAVDTNGQISADSVTADANAEFNAMHPRGKDGKFIKKGSGLAGGIFDALVHAKKGGLWNELTNDQQQHFVDTLENMPPAQWHNLKDEDKQHLEELANAALDDGLPGSAKALQHLDEINGDEGHGTFDDGTDIFDPNTPLPGGMPLTGMYKKIDDAHQSGKITAQQASDLMEDVALGGNEDDIQADLDNWIKINALHNAPPSPKKIAEKKIYDAYDAGEINDAQQQSLLDLLDNHGVSTMETALQGYKDLNKPTPTVDAPMGPSLGAPMKITHGLIHAKHQPGDVIAISKQGNTRVVWDGVEYRVQSTDANGKWNTDAKVKKSKLYAYLGTKHKDAQWHEAKGKQEAPTTHATPLDAAPLTEPIPHPMGDTDFTPLQTEEAINHILKTGDTLYSPNGKYKMFKKDFAGVGVVQLEKKQPDGSWGEGKAVVGNNVPPLTAVWKKNSGPSFASPVATPAEPTLTFDDEDKYKSMWNISQYTPSNMGEINTLWEQYNKGLMTKDEAYQQLQLIKKKNFDTSKLSTETPTKILQSLKMLLDAGKISGAEHTSLVKSTNKGDLLVPKMVISANKPLDVHVVPDLPDNGPLINTKVDVHDLLTGDEEGFTTAQINDAFMNLTPETWHALDSDEKEVINAYAMNVSDSAYAHFKSVKASTPASSSSLSTTSVAPPTIADLSYLQKSQFYSYFKQEKVSPAWSASKIYHSMHAAKAKMGGDPKIAGMSDAELLKTLDIVEQSKTGKVNAYSDKVKEWLKTPNGQKAFKELNPAIPTLTPSIAKKVAPVKKAMPGAGAAYVAKKAAKKVTSSGSSITVDEALGDTSIDPLLDAPKIFASFKNANYGKYLSDKSEHIYWNAVQQSKNVAHSTPGSILALVDEESAKKFGVPNEQKYAEKVKAWLKTPAGKVKSAEIKAGTYSPGFANPASSPSYGSSGFGGTSYAHPANAHINEKIGPPIQQVEDFDPNKGYDWKKWDSKDYPVINDAKAKQMTNDWNAQQGPMNATQKAALRKYSGSSYTPMNDYMRGYYGATDQIHKDVQNAQKGMRLSLEPIVLHRGNGWFKGWNSVADVKSHLGEDFHQEAFFSASIGGKSAFSGPINFVIECPPGTPMAYVDTFSKHPGEREMLLGGNLTYRVVEVIEGNTAPDGSNHFNTQVTVRLRVIPPSSTATDVDTAAE